MNKYQYHSKMAVYFLLASGAALLSGEGIAKTETPKTNPATSVERVASAAKHKLLSESDKSVVSEAVEIESDTQKAIVALQKKDSKSAETILQGVSAKLDNLLAKNPGLAMVPATVETDVFDFEGSNKELAKAIDTAQDLLKHGKLQNARAILSELASEIRINTTSIPLGTYPVALKQIIPLINAGKIDQATVDLSNVLETLVVTTEIMPLPVLRAEELLTVASGLEHRDDLTQEKSRDEIQKFIDASKDQLDRAQLLGYGTKDDYKTLYSAIDGIHKVIFTEKSASAWQKVKDEIAQFKDRLKGLEAATNRVGHPPK